MINITSIQDAIYTWITTQSGREAFWQNQNNPFPKGDKPLFTLQLSNFTALSHARVSEPDANGDVTVVSDYDFTLMIYGFGNGCINLSQGLHSSLQLKTIQDTFAESEIAIVDWLPVQDISNLDGTEMEERSSFDCIFRIADMPVENTGLIEHANISGALDNHGQIRNVDIPINI